MKKFLIVLVAAVAVFNQTHAQKSTVFQNENGAIKGYDPVAYFNESKAVKGNKEYKANWDGATWYFTSQKNKDAFESHPEKYAPQYGGYCAYGTSQGHKAPTDPAAAWTIVDGKLYLNYNTDVMANWRKDTKGLIPQADKNWPEIKDKE